MRDDGDLQQKLHALFAHENQRKEDLVEAINGRGREPPLNPPPVGGTWDGMEPRVAKLEAQMDRVLASLARLDDAPIKLAVIEERVGHLPTKDELGTKLRAYLTTAGTIFAIIGVVIGLGFKFLGR